MKKNSFVFILFLFFSLLFSQISDRIVAKVGNEIILESDINKIIEINKNLKKEEILNTIIEDKILLIKAKFDEITIDVEAINNLLTKRNLDYPEKEEDFIKRDKKKKKIEENYLKSKLIEKNINNKITITDVEIKNFYNLYKNEFPLKPSTDRIGKITKKIEASIKTKDSLYIFMKNILNKINKGESFESLAKKYSDDYSASDGGDMGFFGKGKYKRELEDIAFNMKIGEVSDIISVDYGFHIIKLVDKKFDEIRIRNILKILKPTKEDINIIETEIAEILKELRDGKSFKELLKSNTKEFFIFDNSIENNYPKKVKDEISSLNYGEYSGIIRNNNSLNVFVKLEKVPTRAYTLNEIKDEIKNQIKNRKYIQEYNNYIKKLKEEIYIKIY